MRSTFLSASVLSFALASSAFVHGAHAQGDVAAAQALYDKAVEQMAAKSYAEACPKLEEVTRLMPEGLGAKLTLAECYEGQGRLASAWLQYSLVEAAAGRAGQGERQRLAGERAAALKPKLAQMTLSVPEAVAKMPGLSIKRGGVLVGPVQFGEAIPVDAGKHLIEATAHGKKPWKLEAKIPADGAELVVEVPVLEDDPNARLTDQPPNERPAEEGRPTWLLPVGIAVGSVGVVGLAVGGALGGLAMGKTSEAQDACPNGRCSQEGNDLATEAGTFADAATGLFVAGGVLAAAGIVMIALHPWGEETPASVEAGSVRIRLSPGPAAAQLGAGISGEF